MQPRLTSKRRIGLLIIAVMGIAGAIYFARTFANLTPERVMQALFDVSAPTRFAFVSDQRSPYVAVVDVLAGQQVTTLALDTHPDFWSLSATTATLLYANQKEATVFLYNTATHAKQTIPLQHKIVHWQYNDAQKWLFVADVNMLSVVHLPDGQVTHIENVAHDIQQMFYDAYLQTLWLLSEDGLFALRLQQDVAVERYPLPKGWHTFSPLAATPDGLYLMVGAVDAKHQYRLGLWDLTRAVWVKTDIEVAMQPLVRPYAGSRGEYLWGFGADGQGVRVDVAPPHTVNSLKTQIDDVTNIATGWLDQHIMIAGRGKVALYDVVHLALLQQATVPNLVLDAFVTADSKTALLTLADTPMLYAFSLRDGTLKHVALVDVVQPYRVLMGATATLCH